MKRVCGYELQYIGIDEAVQGPHEVLFMAVPWPSKPGFESARFMTIGEIEAMGFAVVDKAEIDERTLEAIKRASEFSRSF